MTPATPAQSIAPGIRSVCVFCGANIGHGPAAREAAAALGRGLAQAGTRLVYGGGRNGLMGEVADGALAAGGHVTGIIPDFLRVRETEHADVVDMIVTSTMHERKTRMYQLADAFVVLPGGLGTLDETAEVITWRQLRLHDKPILVVNIDGWADRLAALLNGFIEDGFAGAATRNLYEIVPDVATALQRLATLPAPMPGEPGKL